MTGLAVKYSTSFGMGCGLNDLVDSSFSSIAGKHWFTKGLSGLGSRVITAGVTYGLPIFLSENGYLDRFAVLNYFNPILRNRMVVSVVGNTTQTAWHLAASLGAKVIDGDNRLAKNHFKAALKFGWRAAVDGSLLIYGSPVLKAVALGEGVLNALFPSQLRNGLNFITNFIDNRIIGQTEELVPALLPGQFLDNRRQIITLNYGDFLGKDGVTRNVPVGSFLGRNGVVTRSMSRARASSNDDSRNDDSRKEPLTSRRKRVFMG